MKSDADRIPARAGQKRSLRHCATLFAAVLTLTVIVVCLAVFPWLNMRMKLDQARTLALELQRQTEAFRLHETRRQQFSREYGWLDQQHLLTQEKRLEWVESLKHMQKPGRLQVRYSLEPQRDFEWQSAQERAHPLRIRASRIRLEIKALHEGYWLDLMSRLRADVPAWIAARECLAELQAAGPDRALPLSVSCTLEWLSILPRAPNERFAFNEPATAYATVFKPADAL